VTRKRPPPLGKGTGAIVVRRAGMHDVEAVRACLAMAFAPYRADYTPGAYAETVPAEEAIQGRISELDVFIAVCDGDIVGTIGLDRSGAGQGHLRGMAVLPAWQGTPVASQLLEAAVTEARRSGCRLITLDTTEPLQRAIRFYRRHGFVPTPRVSDFFGMRLLEYMRVL
jgi:GNAT superfamily N-acetyltransferase